jgi:hypothetical protein
MILCRASRRESLGSRHSPGLGLFCATSWQEPDCLKAVGRFPRWLSFRPIRLALSQRRGSGSRLDSSCFPEAIARAPIRTLWMQGERRRRGRGEDSEGDACSEASSRPYGDLQATHASSDRRTQDSPPRRTLFLTRNWLNCCSATALVWLGNGSQSDRPGGNTT